MGGREGGRVVSVCMDCSLLAAGIDQFLGGLLQEIAKNKLLVHLSVGQNFAGKGK